MPLAGSVSGADGGEYGAEDGGTGCQAGGVDNGSDRSLSLSGPHSTGLPGRVSLGALQLRRHSELRLPSSPGDRCGQHAAAPSQIFVHPMNRYVRSLYGGTTIRMRITCDKAKRDKTLQERGPDFEDAKVVFGKRGKTPGRLSFGDAQTQMKGNVFKGMSAAWPLEP